MAASRVSSVIGNRFASLNSRVIRITSQLFCSYQFFKFGVGFGEFPATSKGCVLTNALLPPAPYKPAFSPVFVLLPHSGGTNPLILGMGKIQIAIFTPMPHLPTTPQRSYIMSRIRSKDTKPELLLRKALWAKGIRYRSYTKDLPGKPDIVIRNIGLSFS
ncbi:DNA mismatch endonuclease Vsr [Parapedobacter koreensis]|uniref:DNA mismatch endonuclease Vsr n=1 Tax=Parapedobacter koreensis TaxID=332977 RepID=A0A1H7Q0M0_9SPHI|nr:DNA mismatch endonuclease Vsr [Parapedobacter koreensis]